MDKKENTDPTSSGKAEGKDVVLTPKSAVRKELETLRQHEGMARELQTRLFSPKDGGRLSDEVCSSNKEKQRQQEERQKELNAVVPRGSMSAVAKMRAAFDSNPSSSPPSKKNNANNKKVGNGMKKHATDKVLPLDEFHRNLKQNTKRDSDEKIKAADILHHPDQKSSMEGGDLGRLGAFYKYDGIDHRGFVFVVHDVHGMMLLHCTRKLKKGPHFQLPGGHVDDEEFMEAARKYPGQPLKQLLEAAKAGAARELWEETGLDVRADDQISRLRPATLRGGVGDDVGVGNKDGAGNAVSLECMLKNRLYFSLSVSDSDFWNKTNHTEKEIADLKLVSPMGENGSDLMLRISDEHSGFKFVEDPKVSAELLKSHSGGVGREALLMAMTSQGFQRGGAGGGSSSSKNNGKGKGVEINKQQKEDSNDGGTKDQQKDRSIDLSATASDDDNNVVVDLLAKPKRENGSFSCFSFCG